MLLTKEQIEGYFKQMEKTTCPFCHQQDFEVMLDDKGRVKLLSLDQLKIEGKDSFRVITMGRPVYRSTFAEQSDKNIPDIPMDDCYIGFQCQVCGWVALFSYELVRKNIEKAGK